MPGFHSLCDLSRSMYCVLCPLSIESFHHHHQHQQISSFDAPNHYSARAWLKAVASIPMCTLTSCPDHSLPHVGSLLGMFTFTSVHSPQSATKQQKGHCNNLINYVLNNSSFQTLLGVNLNCFVIKSTYTKKVKQNTF